VTGVVAGLSDRDLRDDTTHKRGVSAGLLNGRPAIGQRGRRSEEPPRPCTEVDVFNGDLRIAVELDGPQHAPDQVVEEHERLEALAQVARAHPAPDESMLGASSALFDASHGGLPAEV
jgi:hypothetical protein